MTVEFAPLPEAFLSSTDEIVEVIREDAVPVYEKAVRFGNIITAANHREEAIESALETSDDEEVEKYRLAVEKRAAQIAKLDAAVDALKSAAVAKLSEGMDSGGISVDQASALYAKYRKSFMDNVDAEAFPTVVEALGDFKLPTVRELVGGKRNSPAGSHGDIIRLRTEYVIFDGTSYDSVGAAAKVAGVDGQNVAKLFVEKVGERKLPHDKETSVTVDHNGVAKTFTAKGTAPKVEADTAE
jgi:hypothetical protein